MISDQVGPMCYTTTLGCSRLYRMLFLEIDSFLGASLSIVRILLAPTVELGGMRNIRNLIGKSGGDKPLFGLRDMWFKNGCWRNH